jgi:CspA family cold shock protein
LELIVTENGKVKFWNTAGWGFVIPDLGGKDIFVHSSTVRKCGLRDLKENDRVTFDAEPSPNGKGPQVSIALVD